MRCHYAETASVLLITSSLLLLFEAADSLSNQAADSLSNQAADSLSNRAPSQPHEAFSRRGFLVLPVAFGVGPPLARAEDFSFGAQKRSPLNPAKCDVVIVKVFPADPATPPAAGTACSPDAITKGAELSQG